MKIAIIGSGNIGGTLGKLWAAKGHTIMFSSRSPQSDKIRILREEAGANAYIGTVQEAFAFGEVILLAVPPNAVEEILEKAGDLQQKILINSTNRQDGKSAGMEVIRLARNARVVRAFNTFAWEVLANPQYGTINASMFLVGDDLAAKKIVAELCFDAGLDPVDAGTAENIPLLEESLGTLWRILAPKFGREYCLRVLRRETCK